MQAAFIYNALGSFACQQRRMSGFTKLQRALTKIVFRHNPEKNIIQKNIINHAIPSDLVPQTLIMGPTRTGSCVKKHRQRGLRKRQRKKWARFPTAKPVPFSLHFFLKINKLSNQTKQFLDAI